MTTMDNNTAPQVDPEKTVEFTLTLSASQVALAIVRHDFNPSYNSDVATLKLLCAALMTKAEELWARPMLPETVGDAEHVPNKAKNARLDMAQRNCSIAITHLEDACHHLVKAATA
jgi:hypothetical protein